MMKFKFLLILLFSIFSDKLFAHTLLDSTGVENQNGKKVILHKVEPKENFYSIGRRYNVSPKIIIAYNNNSTSLSIGQIIKVPTELTFNTAQLPAKGQTIIQGNITTQKAVATNTGSVVTTAPAAETATATQYKVSAGETLYAISKRFNTTVADIISFNNLKSNSLTPGQVLLIRPVSQPAPVASAEQQQPVVQQAVVTQQPVKQPSIPVAKRDTTLVATQDTMTINTRNPANRYGLFEKNEKGIAIWMDNDSLDPNKKLVLHRTAPVGTVVKITNPMTNRTTFAKVVGRFTETENTKDAMLVMTKSVAESLGALDKRLHVTISYGTPNE